MSKMYARKYGKIEYIECVKCNNTYNDNKKNINCKFLAASLNLYKLHTTKMVFTIRLSVLNLAIKHIIIFKNLNSKFGDYLLYNMKYGV